MIVDLSPPVNQISEASTDSSLKTFASLRLCVFAFVDLDDSWIDGLADKPPDPSSLLIVDLSPPVNLANKRKDAKTERRKGERAESYFPQKYHCVFVFNFTFFNLDDSGIDGLADKPPDPSSLLIVHLSPPVNLANKRKDAKTQRRKEERAESYFTQKYHCFCVFNFAFFNSDDSWIDGLADKPPDPSSLLIVDLSPPVNLANKRKDAKTERRKGERAESYFPQKYHCVFVFNFTFFNLDDSWIDKPVYPHPHFSFSFISFLNVSIFAYI